MKAIFKLKLIFKEKTIRHISFDFLIKIHINYTDLFYFLYFYDSICNSSIVLHLINAINRKQNILNTLTVI